MPGKLKATRRWHFSYSVLLPVILAVIATVGIIGTFIVWSTARNDDAALARQINLVSHILNDERNSVAEEQEDVATWENTYQALQGDLDMNFIEDNLGLGMHEFYGHDRAYLLDPKLHNVYAMRNGSTVDPKIFESERPILEPLAQRLREINWQGAIAAYVSGASEKIPNITDITTIEGQPAIVSLTPIVSDNRDTHQAPGTEYIHITAEFLDAQLAKELTDLLLLKNARFGTSPDIPENEAALTIRNNAGRPIAYFSWTPDRPGARMLAETAPAIAIATIIAGLIITVLVMRLRHSTAELEAGRTAAQHMALHDALTGLGNRAKFDICVEEAIEKVDLHSGENVALLLLDLDRFKQVNDTLGHEAGDELIQQVAQRLRPLVRNPDMIARLGGDEFAVIAEKIGTEDDIKALCERIVIGIRKPFDLQAGQAFVGVSIGVAIASSTKTDKIELTRKADIALYEAKAGGRNQYKVFENRMNEAVRKRQALEADLRAALKDDDQLNVKFEPLVREDGTEIIGVEASICWTHPDRGVIAPDDFMPLAESCGLVETIGELVLRHTCEVGVKTPGTRMAVRAYNAQLRNPYFYDKIFAILAETGMNPADLEFEVSEKMLSASEEVANATLRKLRQAGVHIALNDFGIGFTSLRLLQQFPVDRIKMDRNFIAELAETPDPEVVTQAVIGLARTVGVEISADGVDTLEQKKFLARMGCTSFQGTLFSPEGQANWLRVAANLEKNLANRLATEEMPDNVKDHDTGT